MPKFPFSPALLDALPEELAELFRGLELKLLEEICSRLKIADNLNEVTIQDIRALRAHGIDLNAIIKAISDTSGVGMDKLNKLMDDVTERNQAYYAEMLDFAKVTVPQRLIDEQDIDAIRRQTLDEYINLTQSMGFVVHQGANKVLLPPAKAYQWALDSAELQVQSGAISYTQAIDGAVTELANSGLCVVYDKDGNELKDMVAYESGHKDHIDVAVRRAVMTGVNQLNAKYRDNSMELLKTDLVETTAHSGARDIDGANKWDNHKRWQGRVYRWRQEDRGYTKSEQRPMTQSATPIQPEKSVPTQQVSATQTQISPIDVTEEYVRNATPGQGSITSDEAFDQSRHPAEVSFSKWLHKMFGGNVHLLNEVNKDKIQTPDYIWRGKLWDLKTVTTEKSADAAIRHGLKQINETPGGIFLDYRRKTVDLIKLQSIIDSRMRHCNAASVDIMVVLSDEIVKVFRYKK